MKHLMAVLLGLCAGEAIVQIYHCDIIAGTLFVCCAIISGIYAFSKDKKEN